MACDTPYLAIERGSIKDGKIYNEDIYVPCGRCPECKRRRVSDWVFRMEEEDSQSSSSLFVTLTYDTKKVPITKNGFMTLNLRDPQLFFKRLRKKTENTVRYYLVGEYGEKKMRPHYHIILYNFADMELLNSAWNLGTIHVGNCSGASVTYVAKYVDKIKVIPLHDRDDRKKEFSTMSKGIGETFVNPNMIKYYKDNIQRLFVTRKDGIRVAMPRYYREKIFTKEEILKQNAYIRQMVEDKRNLKEIEYQDKYPQCEKTLLEFEDQSRYHRYNQFYNKLKPRDVAETD